jgi:hypothetical protein
MIELKNLFFLYIVYTESNSNASIDTTEILNTSSLELSIRIYSQSLII